MVYAEVNMAQSMSVVVYLDSGFNKMVLTYLEEAHEKPSVGAYYKPEASKNLVDIKSITDKNLIVTFDEDKVVIRKI